MGLRKRLLRAFDCLFLGETEKEREQAMEIYELRFSQEEAKYTMADDLFDFGQSPFKVFVTSQPDLLGAINRRDLRSGTLEGAIANAEQAARTEPNKTFIVVAPVKVVCADIPVKTEDWKPTVVEDDPYWQAYSQGRYGR